MNVKSHSFIQCVYVWCNMKQDHRIYIYGWTLVIHLCTYMVAVENPTAVLQESDYYFHAFKEETELQKLEN